MATSPPPLPPTESIRISTARLELVPITREHSAEMFEVLKDHALYEFTGDTPPTDVDALACLYEYWEGRRSPDGSQLWLNWAMSKRESGALIGYAQATVTVDYAQIAWVVGINWQKRGYASEAATALVKWLLQLGVHEIRASIHPQHMASIKVAERAGLERTDVATGREVVWRLWVVEAI